MKTATFQVSKMRGIEQRWSPEPGTAARIRDMTWDPKDGWKDCGGSIELALISLTEDPLASGISTATANPFEGDGQINSIHWFAQHNGARQWLVWEDEDGSLNYFNGSRADRAGLLDPWTTMIDTEANLVTGRKILSTPSARTQSQSWGGRIYFANGYNEVIVFDGTRVEKAGYTSKPTPPSAGAINGLGSDGMHATVFYANGNNLSPKQYHELESCGLGGQNSDISSVSASVAGGILGSSATDGTDTGKRKNGYRYKVTFLNGRGQESSPSNAGGMCFFENGGNFYNLDDWWHDYFSQVNEDGRTFVKVDIPTGPPGTVARRIYRTRSLYSSSNSLTSRGQADNFYFLDEIQDNYTSLFEDGKPDQFLGPLLIEDDFGPIPVGVKMMASFKNTMFMAGHSGSEVVYSAPLYPEVFPPDNVFFIGDADEGPITGMYSTKNALVVLKQKGVYLIKGDPLNGFDAVTLTKDIGCAAPKSIAELPGLGLVFLSEDGIYLLKGALENTGTPTGLVNIGTPIPDLLKKLNTSALLNACGAIYHKDKEYWLAVPSLGSEENDLVLVYHYEVGAWSTRENFPIGCMVESRDHRGYLFYGSNASGPESTTNPGTTAQGIYVYSRGAKIRGHFYSGYYVNQDIRMIRPLYETSCLDFGSVYKSIQPAHVIVYAVAYGNNDFQLNYRVNRATTQLRSSEQTADQQDPNDRQSIYGSTSGVERSSTYPPSIPAIWGPTNDKAGVWANARPVPIRFDVSAASSGPAREMQFTFSPSSRQIQIVGYDIEAKTGEQRNIKPLNEALAPSRN